MSGADEAVLLGSYPCLSVRLVLKRNAGHYVLTMIVPTVVIVALSWSTFFVPVDLPTARLTAVLLLALSSLAMAVLCRGALAPELRGAAYITMLDLWTIACLLFAVGALVLQLVVVSRASRQQQVCRCSQHGTKVCRKLERITHTHTRTHTHTPA